MAAPLTPVGLDSPNKAVLAAIGAGLIATITASAAGFPHLPGRAPEQLAAADGGGWLSARQFGAH